MRGQVRVICRPAVAAGFRLAGIEPEEVQNAADGARRTLSLLDEPRTGVLLVEDDCYEALPDAARRRLARRSLPLVVPFPAPTWSQPATGPEAFIAELLRQAIGYRVRLG